MTGKLGWCRSEFDDSAWQPAIRAAEWGNSPWGQNPNDQYGTQAQWIWDQNPQNLQDSYFRVRFTLSAIQLFSSFSVWYNSMSSSFK